MGLARNSEESISGALWTIVLSGLGAVFVEAVLVGGFYLFEPLTRTVIEDHGLYLLIGIPVIFVAGFGVSLALTLESQLRRGKWN